MESILEERGGLVKVVSSASDSACDASRISRYNPWVQHAEWFQEAGSNCQPCPYAEVQGKMKNSAQLKGLYEKDTDFEDLKSCAEYAYFSQDYMKSAQLWMHILGKYKLGMFSPELFDHDHRESTSS